MWALRTGLALSRLSVEELWVAQVAMSGVLTPHQLQDGLQGVHPLSDHDYDVVAHALNEYLMDEGFGGYLVGYRAP